MQYAAKVVFAGKLLQRGTRIGNGHEVAPGVLGTAALPGVYAQRRVNLDFPLHRRFGGFGAIAFDAGRGSILAIPRMPLDNPDGPDDVSSATSRILRVLEFDVATEAAVGEYVYVLEAADHAVAVARRAVSGFA